MSDRPLFEKVYNPDVLSCLASLSSDEIFTPPELVNEMLDMLPEDLFCNPDIKFLDPCCKSGVFLREIAKRLITGLERQMPDLHERINHIFHNQLYGIAITELTSLLSRRTLYCSKYPNTEFSITHFDNVQGHIYFRKIKHTWNNKKCIYCGASQEQYDRNDTLETHAYEFIHPSNIEELLKMKFDVIIGNPPYQLNDGGGMGASAMPIYHKFVNQAKKMKPNYIVMIIPSRWFTGGKGLDDFRDEMLNDRHIIKLVDFINASDCFPNVEIKGGVCYFLWDKEHESDCEITTHINATNKSIMVRPLIYQDEDCFIRYNEAIGILDKIKKYKEPPFSKIVSNRNPFCFPSNFSSFSDQKNIGDIKIYAMNGKSGFISKSIKISKGENYIPKYKIFVAKAVGSGNIQTDKLNPFIGEPYSICTESFLMIGPFNSKEIADNVLSYIKTKFFHFLLGLKKITQNCTAKVYSLIPIQDFNIPWDDKRLYDKYEFNKDEITYLESMVNSEIGE